MLLWIKFFNVIAIIIQFAGAYIMYRNSPNNTPTIDAFLDIYMDEIKPVEDKKNKWLKFGFLLLVIGLGISLITTILS